MSIDLAGLIRRRKPQGHPQQLQPRPVAELVAAASLATAPRLQLVPDTCVYIDVAEGRLPVDAEDLLDRSLQWHCAVCLGELAAGLGRILWRAAEWKRIRRYYVDLFASIPDSRVLVPDDDMWAEAGMIAGILKRTQGYQADQHRKCLNDSLVFVTAAAYALPVLTKNRIDFDLIQQLAGRGQFVHYT
ncbi:MAG TPA: type II toxin-antitoxin system VapC family toxin [Acetobacteraceae bacterium]|nr:type II toxin-antitoxin system VapC family toxin [Acetobacteraceae bacterium]